MTGPYTARPFHRPAREALRFLPEGPLSLGPGWAAWVAIQHGAGAAAGSVNLLDLKSGVNRSITLPGRPGFVARTRRRGALVVGIDQELTVVNTTQTDPRVIRTGLRIDDDGPTIINDGIAAPFGAIFGTKDPRFRDPIAGLYLFRQADRRLIKLAGGKTCSNGKAVVRGDRGWVLYTVDTHTRTVSRYRLDVEAGRVGPEETWLDLRDEPHLPDGMRLAPPGDRVVIAFYHPGDAVDGVVREYRLADGTIAREWRVPGSPRVTCADYVEVGGAVKLLITTADEGMPADLRARCPEAGTLFLADTDFNPPLAPPDTVDVDHWC